ncbi:hypothetical protein P9112_003492 [Eukaryota sp. TZLM1-RC]
MSRQSTLAQTFKQQIQERKKATAVLAVDLLISLILESDATTIMDLKQQISDAISEMKSVSRAISLTAGTSLFMKFVTRTFLDYTDFDACREALINRGRMFVEHASNSRKLITRFAPALFQDGCTILVHGYSQVACLVLERIAEEKEIKVIVSEGLPMFNGYETADRLSKSNISVTIVSDSAVASILHSVTMVLFGAEGITENGGLINQIGSYGIAVVASHLSKPCYVAAESYKFTRLYPLTQNEVDQFTERPVHPLRLPNMDSVGEGVVNTREKRVVDYTPPEFIDLVLTDIGILTPGAVCDELIKLYV